MSDSYEPRESFRDWMLRLGVRQESDATLAYIAYIFDMLGKDGMRQRQQYDETTIAVYKETYMRFTERLARQ